MRQNKTTWLLRDSLPAIALTAVVFATCMQAQTQKSRNPDLQALKNKLERLEPVLGVVSFLDHNWSERFSSSTGYSLVNIDNSNAQNPSDFHQGHYALANLLYHPVPQVTMGGEFQFGRRLNFTDGYSFNDYKMQFSFKYDWRKSLAY